MPGNFCTHKLIHDCGAHQAFSFTVDILSLKKRKVGLHWTDFYDRVTLLMSELSDKFECLFTCFTVCGACGAFILKEEADADDVKRHTGDVSFESAAPASCTK